MKALYIYNPNASVELALIERVKAEMSTYIEIISVSEIPELLKKYVMATPALIIVNDDLQGNALTAEGIDGNLIATAMLYKRLDEEENAIHNQNNERLDSMITKEKTAAIDEYTLSLIMGGLI